MYIVRPGCKPFSKRLKFAHTCPRLVTRSRKISAPLCSICRPGWHKGEHSPHEIGIFLGYPLEDVVGFVRNKGKNYTFKGYWKAYGDPAAAQARFASFRKCTDVYLRCYRNGTPVTRLTVAV